MISVIDFGMGNIHSILKAISLYTDDFRLIHSPSEIDSSTGIILPGDGAFERAISNLQTMGMVEKISAMVSEGTPIFGICIGFQLLFKASNETVTHDGFVDGLGFLRGKIKKFKGKPYKVPHMGWNKLVISPDRGRILENIENNSYMYFIHSYRAVDTETKSVRARCNYYDESFPVVVEKENIFGTQFHPEKSDKQGLKILENFIKLATK
ncbi:MAG: imidazole glycerol phosphate synthase subunit HisH [Leptospiraceae bacterium]|nr:imidazole glycerol phosphate synthase subunit HisH [Leptospiraceae bacterium]MCP5511518.1 imidazole glycerol phosphate synthase subunit HisH [Leptospiraceae bacterium]